MNMQCRVCLEFSDNCTFLFDACSVGTTTTLAEIIQFCADVKLVEDVDLPSHVCLKCCEDAEAAFMFVKKCRQSERALQANKSLGFQNTTAGSSALIHNFVVEFLTQENQKNHPERQSSTSPLSSPDDDTYLIEYLYEDEVRENAGHGSDDHGEDVQEDGNNLALLNDQSESDSSRSYYYCCHGDCSLTFNTKHELKGHIRLQHHLLDIEQDGVPDVRHSCSNCDHAFSSAKELCSHESLLQLKRRLLNPTRKGRPKTYPCLFNAPDKKCCDCYASFPSIELLLDHTVKRHSIRNTVHDSTRPVRCELCFKLFRCKASLYTHQNAPYKPRHYRCNVCDASFPTRSQLVAHEPVHSSERKFVCGECGAKFKNEKNLTTHALLHSEKKEVCSICGLRFHRKSNLRMHQRVHTDAYYAVCPHCDKKCKNQSQLKEHLKVHTKEKSLACRHCAKRFMYTSDRKRHEMTHTGEYPFVCGCLKKFTRNRPYQQHIAKCNK